ncbi:MAG: TetR/AcrR family transcriptional regulator [Clostridia bacterium]|nr:TetR/AcrR family transcriptional regulator [Clostridia bacterium]
MEEFVSTETVKEKLIIAGISELEMHGIADFSLRRVASECNVSCAAPYKHFKSKEDFIREIVSYIHSQWLMLQNQVMEVFKNDSKRRLVEMCVAYIRFWIGNRHFRSVLMMNTDTIADGNVNTGLHMSRCIRQLTRDYCRQKGLTDEEQQQKAFKINALVYGAALMTDNNMTEANEDTIKMLRKCIEQELE